MFEISVEAFLLQESHLDFLNSARTLSEYLFVPCTSSEHCSRMQFTFICVILEKYLTYLLSKSRPGFLSAGSPAMSPRDMLII